MDLDVVDGYRVHRRRRLWRYALVGRLRGLDGIYVESSTFLPAESDIAFLGLARALGIPVLTYVRDALSALRRVLRRATALKRRLGAAAFLPALRALRAVSSRMAFPTAGLASRGVGSGCRRRSSCRPAPHRRSTSPRSPTREPHPLRRRCAAARARCRPADLGGADRARADGHRPRARSSSRRPGQEPPSPAAFTLAAHAPRRGPSDSRAASRRRRHGPSRGLGTRTTTSRSRSSCSTTSPMAARCS